MSVAPPRDPRLGQPPLTLAFGAHPRARASRESSATSTAGLAAETQSQTNSRIRELNQYASEVERETSQRIDIAKADGMLQQEAEAARSEEAVESQRRKGYERLRDMKRAQQAEVNQLKREGERDLATLQAYYRDTLYGTELRGREQLGQLEKSQALTSEHTRRMSQSELETLQGNHEARREQVLEQQRDENTRIIGASGAELERLREQTAEAKATAHERHLKNYEGTVTRQGAELAALNQSVGGKIREIRLDSARRLDAYSSRQNDPFYQLLEVDAAIEETPDSYVLRARIPEHEQEHISISVRGDQLVLSGSRRNEEKIDLGPGRSQGTSTYQSFQESFPLAFPVDSRRLQRRFEGDELTVVLPKKTTYQAPTYKAARPGRARVERPQFPENLPSLAKAEPPPADEIPAPSPGSKGTRTLG